MPDSARKAANGGEGAAAAPGGRRQWRLFYDGTLVVVLLTKRLVDDGMCLHFFPQHMCFSQLSADSAGEATGGGEGTAAAAGGPAGTRRLPDPAR